MLLSQALTSLGAGPDDRALAIVFERMAPAIRRLATRLTGDAQIGEECVAETVLGAARSAPAWRTRTADPERDAQRWVLGIAATAALAMARARGRARVRDARSAGVEGRCESEAPDSAVVSHERAAIVRSALARLPTVFGEAVRARYVDELDVQAAAARLGVPAATVKTRTFRGLSLLRRQLASMRGMLSIALWPSPMPWWSRALPWRASFPSPLLISGSAAAAFAIAMVVAAGGQHGAGVPPPRAWIADAAPHAQSAAPATAHAAGVQVAIAAVTAPPRARARVVIARCAIEFQGADGPCSVSASAEVPLQWPK
jgi:RNA polymerase sigma-70 factor (ECF subfamily)